MRSSDAGQRVAQNPNRTVYPSAADRDGTIIVPTLIIRGERDDLLVQQDQEALAVAIPGSRLIVYNDTGHLVLWERP